MVPPTYEVLQHQFARKVRRHYSTEFRNCHLKRKRKRKRRKRRKRRIHPMDRQAFLRCFCELGEASGVFKYLGEGD